MAPRTRTAKRDCVNTSDKSISKDRSKRIPRLPKRFEDHSLSPSKFIPIQPCHASTPIARKTKRSCSVKPKAKSITVSENRTRSAKNIKVVTKFSTKSPDTNNNPKTGITEKQAANGQKTRNNASVLQNSIRDVQATTRLNTRSSKNELQISPIKKNPEKNNTAPKRIFDRDFSFKVLQEKELTSKEEENKLACYDFTFDPKDEPQPQKKKRKKPLNKKPAKPRTVYITNNYKNNISKALESLKTFVNKKQNIPVVQNNEANKLSANKALSNPQETTNINEIPDISYNKDINYSPMASPNPDHNVKLSNINETRDQIRKTRATGFRPEPSHKDPLNLIDDLNSFDEMPVACSSMNISTRLAEASPWRVEFNELPIKWPTNAYIKPNMTPAVESSYINLSLHSKKHVYTGIVPISNDDLPEIVNEKEHSTNLKQSTMLDFIKETVEKSTRKRNRSKTPSKKSNEEKSRTPKKLATSKTLQTPDKNVSNEKIIHNSNTPPENIQECSNTPTHEHDFNDVGKENVQQRLNNTENFFGFNDSENQENISPKKKDNNRIRTLRSRSRAVLGEINKQVGPTRANLPFSVKDKFVPSSNAINKIFDEIKAATKAPVIENNPDNVETTIQEPIEDNDETNDDSVHLFEDLEVIHHFHQPNRKSYSKAKKETFQETRDMEEANNRSVNNSPEDEECDLDEIEMMEMELPFDNPTIKDKKVVKPKKGIKLTKKEEQEVEEWAAAFNSMCEDVEDFPLMVE